jgi:hypothetical protein
MTRTAFIIALVLSSFSTASALRITDQPESPFELALGDVTMPASSTGWVSFKTCETCSTETRRVSAATKYFIDGAPLTLEDFLLAVAGIRGTTGGNENTFVGLYVDNESQRVNRIKVQQRKK